MKHYIGLFMILFVLFWPVASQGQSLLAADQIQWKGGWWHTKSDYQFGDFTWIEAQLLNRDLIEVSRFLEKIAPPQTQEDKIALALFRMHVYTRAGHRAQAKRAIDDLQLVSPHHRSPGLCWYVEFLSRHQEFELTTHLFEKIPLAMNWYFRREEFYKYLLKQMSPVEVETWVTQRSKENPQWIDYQWFLAKQGGKEEQFFENLKQVIEANPENGQLPLNYLKYLSQFQVKKTGNHTVYAPEWMETVCQPDSAVDCCWLSEFCFSPKAKISFLERAKLLPVKEQDLNRGDLGASSNLQLSSMNTVHELTQRVREMTLVLLAHYYREIGQLQSFANRHEDLFRKMGKDHSAYLRYAWLAGYLQREIGVVIFPEQVILKGESRYKNNLDYWLSRAEYYKELGDGSKAFATVSQALRIFPLDGSEKNQKVRLKLLDLCRSIMLTCSGSTKSGSELLKNECAIAPPHSEYQWKILKLNDDSCLFGPQKHIDFQNDSGWKLVSEAPVWHSEIINWIGYWFDKVPPEKQEECLVWLESVAAKGDSSKKCLVGTLLSKRNLNKRAELLLKQGYEESRHSTKRKLEDWVGWFRFLINQGRGKEAESVFWSVPISDWVPFIYYSIDSLLLLAVKEGRFEDALKLWKFKTNMNRINLKYLDKLAQTDLKEPLIEYYESLKAKDSESWVPDHALQILNPSQKTAPSH